MSARVFAILAGPLLIAGCSELAGPDPSSLDSAACMSELSGGSEDGAPTHLAVMELQQSAAPADQPVEIPGALIDRYEGVLEALCSSGQEEVATAVGTYQAGLGAHPSTRRVMLHIDTVDAGMRRWAIGERFTGYDDLDSLVVAYDLQPREWLEWRDVSEFVLFESDRPLNIQALAERITRTGRVIHAEQDFSWQDARDLDVMERDGGYEVALRRGWGDCMAGCIYGHTWRFAVAADGSTEFLSSSGDPLPPPPVGWAE